MGLLTASEIVRRALEDADNLSRTSGPQSAVDRVHTAMHSYLLSLCADAGIEHGDHPTMNQLFKAGHHVCLDALTQLLDTGEVSPDVGADPSAVEAEYEAPWPRCDQASETTPPDRAPEPATSAHHVLSYEDSDC